MKKKKKKKKNNFENQSPDSTGESIVSECRLGKLSWMGTLTVLF